MDSTTSEFALEIDSRTTRELCQNLSKPDLIELVVQLKKIDFLKSKLFQNLFTGGYLDGVPNRDQTLNASEVAEMAAWIIGD